MVLMATTSSPARAQDRAERPPIGEPRPFVLPETESFTLENGLTVILAPYGSTPKATVRLVLPTGTVHEGADEVWLGVLTGDLMQEGTTSRSSEKVATEAAAVGGGVSLGVGSDRTTIGGDVLEEFAPDLVRLVADVVRNPALPESELDRLKDNRLRALSVALQRPRTLAQVEFLRRLYPDHPYGRSLPTSDMVRGYSLETVRAFWSDHYAPDGARLYVTGRFDVAAVRAAAREAFASWPTRSVAAAPPAQAETSATIVFVPRPGAPQSTLYVGLPVVDPSHPDYLALDVTDALLGGSASSRMARNLREDKGYTYSPQSFVSSRFQTAYWVQTADVAADVTGAALREIRNEIDRLRSEPPPEQELRGIRNYLAGIFVLQNSSRAGIVGQLAFLDLHGLPPEYLTSYVERVHAVTPEDVLRMARTYLDPDRMLLVVTGDPEVALPQLRAMGSVEVVEPPAP
jgi:predicted Zn-dependent peptidase